ncbi:glycosyltransferase involved in cell wall biosynthesis [Chitinophaga niastensis]|uniref:Glycosyltransferase involved in cell wall biosynthesis n=1 Tax=Chitinophaga niastensis TaxID=536980 RepID=A0A2P8HTB8_CHINA|nr:glycosyltransferase family A protein [Chitinophaga niastensis]PSL49480.1 glycosyltransferase involved in cell wall biosynthesis [Chitinophaga niastensis]
MQNRISFCTVCMNRTMHLKETLHRNILDNIGYDNIEFVLLDYNSKDDLYDWAQKELQPYIDEGRLTYFHTKDPQFFHMSHSKNMALRLATGDILCSIDADNYTGEGFATYINEIFNKEEHVFMAPPPIGPGRKWWDVQGRVCVRRDDFYALRGYDERVIDYGYEDKDFKSRLESTGRRRVIIKDQAFLRAITHDDSLRIADGFFTKKSKELFFSVAGDNTSEIIYLDENNVFERFYVDNNLLVYENDCPEKIDYFALNLKNIYVGTYKPEDKGLRLYKENGKELLALTYQTDDHLIASDHRDFYRVSACLLRENLLFKRAIYRGKKIFSYNKVNGNMVNGGGFGQGTVYKNFSDVSIDLDCPTKWLY